MNRTVTKGSIIPAQSSESLVSRVKSSPAFWIPQCVVCEKGSQDREVPIVEGTGILGLDCHLALDCVQDRH